MFYPYDSHLDEKSHELRRKRKELLNEKVNYLIKKIKNYPSPKNINNKLSEPDLIAAVHEDLTLRQMQKSVDNNPELFWKNQQRFLEFIDIKNPYIVSKKANPGYRYSHGWFLNNNKDYASKFIDITPKHLAEYRLKNWKNYNNLCKKMQSIAPKYHSIDSVLIPVSNHKFL